MVSRMARLSRGFATNVVITIISSLIVVTQRMTRNKRRMRRYTRRNPSTTIAGLTKKDKQPKPFVGREYNFGASDSDEGVEIVGQPFANHPSPLPSSNLTASRIGMIIIFASWQENVMYMIQLLLHHLLNLSEVTMDDASDKEIDENCF